LENDPRVDWSRVQEIHDQWDYESEGLAPAASIVVAIAVAIATGPGGFASLGFGAGPVGAALQAGYTALASQATISTINNKGDLGAVFDELGSSESIKSIAAAMATAGLVRGDLVPNNSLWNIAKNITYQAAVKSTINTAINGGSLGDNLVDTLQQMIIQQAAASAANAIGGATASGSLENITAHAALGCIAAKAGGKDCGSGAVGGAISASIAPTVNETINNDIVLTNEERALIVGISELSAAIVALAVGKDPDVAATAARNEVENNYLSHWQQAQKHEELAACKTDFCKHKINIAWGLIDAQQDLGVIIGVGGGIGLSAYEMAEGIALVVMNPIDTFNGLKAVLNDPEVRAQLGAEIVQSYEQRINTLVQAREDAGWDGSITNGVESGRLALEGSVHNKCGLSQWDAS
uniref:DUF637 domain-containing protein n=1 Tax=Parendozoicomonas sp. Alg238-R29 TaxID=2993446 RepID=UPI00248E6976